jgi:hypothetical protein
MKRRSFWALVMALTTFPKAQAAPACPPRPRLLAAVKPIRMKNGSYVKAVAEFNDGHSHIIRDDSCWVVINDGGWATHITEEAMSYLVQLPANPRKYGPLNER